MNRIQNAENENSGNLQGDRLLFQTKNDVQSSMVENLNQLALEIIKNNQYCSLATVDDSGEPWISPVAYTFDEKWNLYFVSMTDSKHCQNFKNSKKVALSIFDSRQEWGAGIGLQIEAEVGEISVLEIPKVTTLYAMRKYPYGGIKRDLALHFIKSMVVEHKTYKIYKITPKMVWMNDPNADTDVRVAVELAA